MNMFDIPIDTPNKKTLEDTIGNNEQDKAEIKKQMTNLFGVGENKPSIQSSGKTKQLAIKLICPRYKNLYIFSKPEVEALRKSIKESGLIEPITVINIDQYLDPKVNDNLSQSELDYYNNMKAEYGCEYFISSGHKRYRAVLSNLLNTYIDSDKEIFKFYKDIKSGKINISVDDKRYFIDCIVGNPNALAEDKISKRTNGLARTLTAFERVANAVDSIARIKKLNDSQINAIKTDEIQKFIKETDGVDIDYKTIANNWGCVKKVRDTDILELVSKGQIAMRDIKALSPIYDKVIANDDIKKTLIKDAKSGCLDMTKIKEMVKPSKGRPKKQKTITLSKAEVLDILHQIKLRTLKIDDAITRVEKLK